MSNITAPSENVKTPYRLDKDTSTTFAHPDGRKIGYAQYGAPEGRAVFYLHGMPGSRIEAAAFHDMAIRIGARVIAVDRPGYGLSSPQPNRTLLDHPKDLETLADHLKLKSYGVMGVSGGGAYVLASAFALPADKLKAVAVVCGLGPPDIGYSGTDWKHWAGFKFGFHYAQGFTRWWFSRDIGAQLHLSDEKRLELRKAELATSKLPEKDAQLLEDENFLRLMLLGARQSNAQGQYATVEDGRLMTSDFGFRIEDIRKDLPVWLWYGKHDHDVPANHGVQIAARLSGAGGDARLRVEDETHAGLFLNCRERMLEDLVTSMGES